MSRAEPEVKPGDRWWRGSLDPETAYKRHFVGGAFLTNQRGAGVKLHKGTNQDSQLWLVCYLDELEAALVKAGVDPDTVLARVKARFERRRRETRGAV